MKRFTNIATSFLAGQAIFFIFGYDQWGLFMRPKVQLGFGQKVAHWAYDRLPHTSSFAWILKAVEIAADAGKMPIEGALFSRRGVVPDGLAALVTQPLFSGIETAEKVLGAALHPERVAEPYQMRMSLGCIYGSLFRYGLTAMLWVASTPRRPS
jgi:hypothetical protein